MRERSRKNYGDSSNDNEKTYESDSSDDESSVTNDSEVIVSESEILYSIESFNAVFTPVTITMVVSALVVVFINTEGTIAAGEDILASFYHILDVESDESSEQSSAQKLGNSLVNTLVIVSVFCVLTFLVVLCYKYRCMKIFYAYMVLVTVALLGYLTYVILMVAISIYPWISVDKFTLYFLLYNYAVVGTVAIFLPRGFPRWIPQGYLIAGSVCMAWYLSFFNSWMTWTLLVMLALYDLFAVLAPCGPLKALAELISRDGAPALPGMLYEARLPSGMGRNRRQRTRSVQRDPHAENDDDEINTSRRRMEQNAEYESNDEVGNASGDPVELNATRQSTGLPPPSQTTTTNPNSNTALHQQLTTPESRLTRPLSQSGRRMVNSYEREDGVPASGHQQQITHHGRQQIRIRNGEGNTILPSSQPTQIGSVDMSGSIDVSHSGKAPLVLAKMYKLPVLDKKGVLRPRAEYHTNGNENDDSIRPQPIYYTAEQIQEIEWTPTQLATRVTCVFPPRGGWIAKARSREQKFDAGTAYIVYDRSGNQQRKFVVTPTGSVMQVLRREASGDGNDGRDDDKKNTIKLGIGDFIFYSLLVSQAAQHSFTAFASCLLVVLTGLAATLVILAIKGKALPALPISIFLGVIAFLWTKLFIQPWIGDFVLQSLYV